MSKSSKFEDIASEENKMQMTPMIDVTFLLLIFFLCTLQFKQLEGNLAAYLPKGVGASAFPFPDTPKEKVEIVIRVREAGEKVYAAEPDRGQPWQREADRRFEIVNRELQYQVGSRKTLRIDELRRWLSEFHRQDPDARTTIDSRAGTTYGDVVPVLDSLAATGFTDVTFAGVRRN